MLAEQRVVRRMTSDPAIRELVEEMRKNRDTNKQAWAKVLASVGGALLVASGLFTTFVMPSIREETRSIVNDKVQSLREEREKDTGREYQSLKERLDRIEGKLDRVIEKK